jgi:hypothetical protein
MALVIPKTLLTNVYLGDEGPYAGHYARPCYCGESLIDSDDELVLAQRPDGELMLMHRACTPMDADDYA